MSLLNDDEIYVMTMDYANKTGLLRCEFDDETVIDFLHKYEEAVMQKLQEQNEPVAFIEQYGNDEWSRSLCWEDPEKRWDYKPGTRLYEHPPVPANSESVFIVFDGPPDQESPRFLEVETANGVSVKVGDWKPYGEYWTLGPLFANQAPGAPEGWPSNIEYNPHFVGHVDDLFDEAVIEHAEFTRTDLVFIAAARSE